MDRQDRKRLIAGCIVGGLALGAVALHALQKVLGGQGIESYRNYRGALLNHASVLVAFGIFALCAAGAYVYAWYHKRQERKLDEFIAAQSKPADTDDLDRR